MGEIADMMLEGVLCQSCGEYMGDGDGFAVTCAGCARQIRARKNKPKKKPAAHPVKNGTKPEAPAETTAAGPSDYRPVNPKTLG